jgi:hypothetical protein
MIIAGRIRDYDPDQRVLRIDAPFENVADFARKKYEEVEVHLHDGRNISPRQRAKAWAIVADICRWSGYGIRDEAEDVNETLKAYFCAERGIDPFSLANTDMTTARGYINYLIDFVLAYDVPCLDRLLNRTDDIDATLYAHLYHSKCVICGKKAVVHHCDTVGMGRDREEIVHVGMRAMALCSGEKGHHGEVHRIGQKTFEEKYHVYGIALDEILVKRLSLGKSA